MIELRTNIMAHDPRIRLKECKIEPAVSLVLTYLQL